MNGRGDLWIIYLQKYYDEQLSISKSTFIIMKAQGKETASRFFEKYNTYRPHQVLRNLTPAGVYYGNFKVNDF